MGCGCKKKTKLPVEQTSTTVIKSTENNNTTNTIPVAESSDIDNNTLLARITNRLKEITS